MTATTPGGYTDSLTCTSTPASVKNVGSGIVTPSMNWGAELSTNYTVTSVNGAVVDHPGAGDHDGGQLYRLYDGNSHAMSTAS